MLFFHNDFRDDDFNVKKADFGTFLKFCVDFIEDTMREWLNNHSFSTNPVFLFNEVIMITKLVRYLIQNKIINENLIKHFFKTIIPF